MCIGIPMQLLEVQGPRGLATGRSGPEWLDLRLVDACIPGDWVLAFQGAARERLDPRRAAEIDAALDLLQQGLAETTDPPADPGFELPSSWTPAQLAALTGRS